MDSSLENRPLLTAKELLAYRRRAGMLPEFPPPRAVIFAPQPSLAFHILRKHATRKIKGFVGEFHLLKRLNGQVAVSTGFGIGSPAIAGLTDEFAALGVQQFYLIGMAGALQPNLATGDLIISTGSIRDEGVSRHYLPPAEIVHASTELSQGISAFLSKHELPHSSGLTWTTDAPYRELQQDVRALQNRGVLAVDMESAAMLAVAQACSLPALAVFAIADTLANGVWSMSKDLHPARAAMSTLFEAVLEYLTAS